MRVLVTRPEPDGERTAAKLRAHGCEVLLAPMLKIEPVDAAIGAGPWAGVALTSINAVRALARHPRRAELLSLPAFAVGARTASEARAIGFKDVATADGDFVGLVQLIRARGSTAAPLLYLAGEDRAGDLGQELAANGIMVETVVMYRAAPVSAFPDGARDALSAGKIDGVLHFSRRSAENFLRCAWAAGILADALRPAHLCLSRAVAAPLAAAGAARIEVAERPHEAALLALIAVA